MFFMIMWTFSLKNICVTLWHGDDDLRSEAHLVSPRCVHLFSHTQWHRLFGMWKFEIWENHKKDGMTTANPKGYCLYSKINCLLWLHHGISFCVLISHSSQPPNMEENSCCYNKLTWNQGESSHGFSSHHACCLYALKYGFVTHYPTPMLWILRCPPMT